MKKENINLSYNKENNSIARFDNKVFLEDENEIEKLKSTNNLLFTNGVEFNENHHEQIDELVILSSQQHFEKLQEYHNELNEKLDILYEKICIDAQVSNAKINNRDSSDVVEDNEVLLNRHTTEVEKVCNQVVFEWKNDVIADLNTKYQFEYEIAKERFQKSIQQNIPNYYNRLVEAQKQDVEITKVPFKKEEFSTYTVLQQDFENQLKIKEQELFKESILAIEKDINEVLSSFELYKVKEQKNWNNYQRIALFISKEIGIIQDLEKLLNEQELIRTENFVGRAELNAAYLNDKYNDKDKYSQALYNARLQLLYTIGSEITILKYLIQHQEILYKIRKLLEDYNHPLSSYAFYNQMLERIKLYTFWRLKAESIKNLDNEYDIEWLINSLGDEYKQTTQIKKEVVYKNKEVITNNKIQKVFVEPQYNVEVITNDDKNISVGAYIGSQKLDTKTTLKK